MQKYGFKVYPVNPRAKGQKILGEEVFEKITDIKDKIDIVDVFRPSKEVYAIAEDTVKIGAKVLWLQLGIRDEEAKKLMNKNNIDYVENKCTKMEYQNFFLKKSFSEYQILNGLNFHLGDEKIKISNVEKVDDNFNARFTAKTKTYLYQVYNSLSPSVLEGEFSIHIKQKLNISAMQTAINFFQGNHDFSAFRSSGCQAKTPVKSVKEANIDVIENKLIFVFKAQSFLYQQALPP